MTQRSQPGFKKQRPRTKTRKANSTESPEVRRKRMVNILQKQVRHNFEGNVNPFNTIDYLVDRICFVEMELETLREACPRLMLTGEVDRLLRALRGE